MRVSAHGHLKFDRKRTTAKMIPQIPNFMDGSWSPCAHRAYTVKTMSEAKKYHRDKFANIQNDIARPFEQRLEVSVAVLAVKAPPTPKGRNTRAVE